MEEFLIDRESRLLHVTKKGQRRARRLHQSVNLHQQGMRMEITRFQKHPSCLKVGMPVGMLLCDEEF